MTLRVRALMTRDVLTIGPPVVSDGQLVGVVTRPDLVPAFVRPDGDIEREIVDDVLTRTLWVERGTVDVEVARGSVTLNGTLRSRCDGELLEVSAARVPGVVSVASNVAWEIDDLGTKVRRRPGWTLR